LALCGGVGGAKLALGLYRVLGPGQLTVIANTGDDFEHLGLHVSPDVDTVLYTLAGLDNPETGWGRAGETWSFMAALGALGGETWFRLGDGDLAIHVERTHRLAAGRSLTEITADFRTRLGVTARLLPMSNDALRTVIHTAEGALPFQRYFVEKRCEPVVTGIAFDGAKTAQPNPAFLAALADPKLRAVMICPSNPFISIDPILSLPGVRDGLAACRAPVVAVAPIVGGRAIKGPTAKIMGELGFPATAAAVASHYGALLDGFVLDDADARAAADMEIPVTTTRTVMKSPGDREALARDVLAFADLLAQRTITV
jgi:LPPG:FO 2-phospho-L-lactate transferase